MNFFKGAELILLGIAAGLLTSGMGVIALFAKLDDIGYTLEPVKKSEE